MPVGLQEICYGINKERWLPGYSSLLCLRAAYVVENQEPQAIFKHTLYFKDPDEN